MANNTANWSAVALIVLSTWAEAADPVEPLDLSKHAVIETSEPETVADPSAPIEVIQERYPSGQVKVRREVSRDTWGNYILHGSWTMYLPDGREVANGQYLNNRRHGAWTRTHARRESELFNRAPFIDFEEPFTSQATFKNGQLDGTWTMIDGQGRQITEWIYVDGKRDGTCTWWFSSGSAMREIDYQDGLMEGMHREWTEDGQLTIEDTYQSGRKLATVIKYYDDGTKQSEGVYLHPQFVAHTTDDWWSARPVSYKAQGEPKRHGRYTDWYSSGQVRVEGVYLNGVPSGAFIWRHANGQQSVSGSFRQGERHGSWVWWFENGQKTTEGQYTDGHPSGQWAYWSQQGKLTQKVDYDESPEAIAKGDGKSSPSTHQAAGSAEATTR